MKFPARPRIISRAVPQVLMSLNLPQYPHILLRVPLVLADSFEQVLKNDESGAKSINFRVSSESKEIPSFYVVDIDEDDYPAVVRNPSACNNYDAHTPHSLSIVLR